MKNCQLFHVVRGFVFDGKVLLVNDLVFMKAAYDQARRAYRLHEVPIGAVLVDREGKIIARGFNQIEKKGTQIAHAEMQVLAKAAKKMKNWRLSDLTLYVTVQPCLMCLGALYLSRISRIVYGVESPKFGASLDLMQSASGIYKNFDMKIACLNYHKSKELLQLFFQKKRSLVYDE